MSRKSVLKGGDHVNVQVDIRVAEMLKLLKKKKKARSVSDALEAFIREHDAEIAAIGTRRGEELIAVGEDAE